MTETKEEIEKRLSYCKECVSKCCTFRCPNYKDRNKKRGV